MFLDIELHVLTVAATCMKGRKMKMNEPFIVQVWIYGKYTTAGIFKTKKSAISYIKNRKRGKLFRVLESKQILTVDKL